MKAVAVFPGKPDSIHLAELGAASEGYDFLVTGHESFGHVLEVGRNVRDLEPGDYVVATVRRPGDAAASDGREAIISQDLSVDQSQFNAGFDGDSDDDGIFDEFDLVILSGDFDNNGIMDDFEF